MAKKLITSITFGLIVLVYIFVRLPVFNQPLGVELHGDKYATHLPVLMNMWRAQDPFFYSNPNSFSILADASELRLPEFGLAPVVEWMLLPAMPFTQIFSLDAVVRTAQTIYGVLLLVLIYVFLQKAFAGRSVALLVTALIAVNPVFQLVTLITTRDLPALVLLLGALIAWQYQHRGWAYLLVGGAVLTKYSFGLIGLPIFGFLLVAQKKGRVFELVRFGWLATVPTLLFKLLMDATPGDVSAVAALKSALFVLGLVGVYLLDHYVDVRRDRYRQFPTSIKVAIVSVGIIVAGGLFYPEARHFAAGFLADVEAILSLGSYQAFVGGMQKVTGAGWLYLPVVIAATLISTRRLNKTPVLLAFLVGSLVYLVVASKSIFPHLYYQHVFVLLFFFSSAYLVQVWTSQVKDTVVQALVFATLLMIFIPSQAALARQVLQSNPIDVSIGQVGLYLDQHLDEAEKALGPDLLNVYTSRVVINPDDVSRADREILNREAQEHGTVATFQKYGVKYFVATQPINSDGSEVIANDFPELVTQLEENIGQWYIYRL